MIKRLSTSSVNLYLQCPRKWKYRYLDRVPAPVGVALPFGTAFHNMIEEQITTPVDSRAPLGELWPKHWASAVGQRHDISWGTKTFDGMLELGQRMADSESIKDTVNLIVPMVLEDQKPLVEKYFSFVIPQVGVPFVGYVDVVQQNGIVADFKTAGKRWPAGKAEKQLQAQFYLAGLQAIGVPIQKRTFQFFIFTKTKAPQAVTYTLTHTEQSIQFALDVVKDVWRGIKGGAFPICDSSNFLCNERFCEYWEHCGRG